jgi:hypothetical protein
MVMAPMEAQTNEFYARAERRIGWLTLVLGLAASVPVAVAVSLRAGAGVAVGTGLAWVNYRWLEQAVAALVRLSTARSSESRPRVSVAVSIKFFARYALIGLVVYVMVARFAIPVLSILGGLFALGAAAVAESLYEVFGAVR